LSSHDDILFQSAHPAPDELTETETTEETSEQIQTPWRVILYDDDVHTFDEVINQLIKALGCSLPKAEDLTWQVHNEGKAMVFEGDFEECLRIDAVLKEIQLITEIKG
jgi:ATP-dependent Clp protease adapter protein ClpS